MRGRGPAHDPARTWRSTVYYRGNELPADLKPELVATRHYRVTGMPFVFTNGAMASYVEVDGHRARPVLHFWVVEDCGTGHQPDAGRRTDAGRRRAGNRRRALRGMRLRPRRQLLNATMADYLVPMAVEMPDITVAHVVRPTRTSALGAKGAGEAGTGGAPAAVMNAVNDALRPLGARSGRCR
jgi:aerobic carbon-monoxide dehydrogenase large subunit